MEVKGTSPKNLVDFIRTRFGSGGLEHWLDSLPPDVRSLFEGKILPSSWYPADKAFFVPAEHMCRMFYGSDIARGAWELGRFSAENTLRGVYKAFVRIATPSFVLARASKIFETFYRPGRVRLVSEQPGQATVQVFNVDERSGLWENRMGGFIEATVEIAGFPKGLVRLTRSVADGGDCIEYDIRWQA